MKKLLEQIIKFGVVGVLAFLIDFTITMVLSVKLRTPCLNAFGAQEPAFYIASFCGFVISLIFNYVASMTFVFKRRENTSKKEEFVKFTILSIIGLGIHEVVLLISMKIIEAVIPWFLTFMNGQLSEAFCKIAATGVVMIYNFITRKIFLEAKEQ